MDVRTLIRANKLVCHAAIDHIAVAPEQCFAKQSYQVVVFHAESKSRFGKRLDLGSDGSFETVPGRAPQHQQSAEVIENDWDSIFLCENFRNPRSRVVDITGRKVRS